MHAIHQTHERPRPRIVIVGAGISGLALATFLRDLNADVLVLEQPAFRRKSQFVGLVSPAELRALGADPTLGLSIATVERTDHARSVGTTSTHAVEWRAIAHGDLLRAIRSPLVANGVPIIDDFLVTDLLLGDGAVTGVRDRERRAEIQADLVVLADESDPRLSEPLGLRPDWLPTELAHLGKARISADARWIEATFGREGQRLAQSVRLATSWGAVGMGAVVPEVNAVTVLAAMSLEAEMQHSRHIREVLDEMVLLPEVARLLPDSIGEDFTTEVVPMGGYRHPINPATDGLMLVSDLVGITNPLLRDGLSNNLGMCAAAALTIQDAVSQMNFDARNLARYRQRLQREIIATEGQSSRADITLGTEWAMTAKSELASYLGGVTKRPESATLPSRAGSDGIMRRLRGLGRHATHRRRSVDD